MKNPVSVDTETGFLRLCSFIRKLFSFAYLGKKRKRHGVKSAAYHYGKKVAREYDKVVVCAENCDEDDLRKCLRAEDEQKSDSDLENLGDGGSLRFKADVFIVRKIADYYRKNCGKELICVFLARGEIVRRTFDFARIICGQTFGINKIRNRQKQHNAEKNIHIGGLFFHLFHYRILCERKHKRNEESRTDVVWGMHAEVHTGKRNKGNNNATDNGQPFTASVECDTAEGGGYILRMTARE